MLDRPLLDGRPALLVDKLERGMVLDTSALAADLGARPGMTLTQAVACAREAEVYVDDRARCRALWDQLLEALDAASPLVEDAAEGTAYLEMRGIEGTPARWIAAVRETLADWPLGVRLGCAANKFTARAAAIMEDGRVCAPGSERTFLAPLPLAMLALPRDTREKLALLGVGTLGDLAKLPAGPFTRRFGNEGMRWHARARGIDPAPIVPRPRFLAIDHTLYGAGSAEREEQVFFALRTLVARVAEDVALAGRHCGKLVLTLECENGDVHHISCVLAQPTAQASMFFDLLRARVEGLALGSPLAGLRLGAERLEEGGRALSLFPSSDPDPEILQLMIARLDAALGEGAARRIDAGPGYRYETRTTHAAFTAPVQRSLRVAPESAPPLPQTAPLQFRLRKPARIEVTIAQGGPAFVGTPPQAVLDYAGPWRSAEGWWDIPLARDEYDVLLEDGTLYRLARCGKEWMVTGAYD